MLACSAAPAWPQGTGGTPPQRNFWDLREPAHTEEHAQQGFPRDVEPLSAKPREEASAAPPAPSDATPAPQSVPQPAAPAVTQPAPAAGGAAGQTATAGEAAADAQGGGDAAGTADAAAPPAEPEGESLTEGQLEARSLDALYRLGQAAVRRGQVRLADRLFGEVLRRAPYHFLTHLAMGRLHLGDDPARARRHLETATRIHTSSIDAYYLLGQANEALGRNLEAAEAYRRTIHLDPRHYNANARLRAMLRRMRAGRSVLERAAESFYAQPNVATLTLFGRLVMEHAPPREAVLEFEEVLRRAPGLTEAHLWLARASRAAADVQGEVAAYRAYLTARPEATGVRLHLVERLTEQGWFHDAAALLESLARGSNGSAAGAIGRTAPPLSPDARARVTFLRSRMQSARQQPAEAGATLLLAQRQGYAAEAIGRAFAEDVALFPEAAGLWFAYGDWLTAAGRFDDAAEAFAQAGVLAADRRDEAQARVQALLDRQQASIAGALALGRLAWAAGDDGEALERLAAVPPGHALDARAALLRGLIHRARGELDAALDAFTRYVFFFEDRRDVLYARGNLFWQLGRREEALAVWMRDPDVLLRHPGLLRNVAEHHQANGDSEAEAATRWRLARTVPADHENRVRLGELYAAQGRRREAAEIWAQLAAERPRDVQLLLRAGRAWLELNDLERGLSWLQKASQLTELDADTSALLARHLYRDRQYAEALRLYWQLHGQQPQHPELPGVLPELVLSLPATTEQRRVAAEMAERGGRHALAAELYEALLHDEPQNLEARIALAAIYLRTDQAQRAEALLLTPTATGQVDAAGLELMATVQERLGRKTGLAQTLEQLHELRPDDPALPRRRGLLLAGLNRPAEARPLLERAVAGAPDDDTLRLALADVAAAQGDAATAEYQLTTVLGRTPDSREASRRLIALLLKAQRWADVAPRLERWVAQHPGDALARYNLISAYLTLFRKEDARPHYEALQQLNPARARPLAAYFR